MKTIERAVDFDSVEYVSVPLELAARAGKRCVQTSGETPARRSDANHNGSNSGDVGTPDHLVQLDLIADGQLILEHPFCQLAEVHRLPHRREEQRAKRALLHSAVELAGPNYVACPLVVCAVLDD